MLNEKNKIKDTNNLIPKMSDRLKHVDYCRHLWRPFWLFSNARIMRRTPGSDSAPPNYQKKTGCPLFLKNASRTLFNHIFRSPNQSIIYVYAYKYRHTVSFILSNIFFTWNELTNIRSRHI